MKEMEIKMNAELNEEALDEIAGGLIIRPLIPTGGWGNKKKNSNKKTSWLPTLPFPLPKLPKFPFLPL